MQKAIYNTVKIGTASLLLLTLSACQNTKAIDEVRALATKAGQDAAAAQTTANSASSAASAANKAAATAQTTADKAQTTANQALQAAKTAQAGVDATNEKLDRMFKQSVSK